MDNKRVLTGGIFPAIVFTVGCFFFSRGINRFRRDIDYRSRRDVSWNITRGIRIKKKHDTHTFAIRYTVCLCDLTSYVRDKISRDSSGSILWQRSDPVTAISHRIIDPSPTLFPPLLLDSSFLPAGVSSTRWISILSGSATRPCASP